MVIPILKYCNFCFSDSDRVRHDLRIWVCDLDLEWSLHINDVEVGRFRDLETNVALTSHMQRALSWANIVNIYNDLLRKHQTLKP